MNKKLFSKADEESIDIVERALGDLRKLGATIVDPGPEGALFQSCVVRYAPELLNRAGCRFVPRRAGGPMPLLHPRASAVVRRRPRARAST